MDIQSEYEYMPWCIYLIASRREVLFALLAKNHAWRMVVGSKSPPYLQYAAEVKLNCWKCGKTRCIVVAVLKFLFPHYNV